MQNFVDLANRLADEAAKISKKYFRTSFVVESKYDDTPVTIADREIETVTREIIEEMRPQDGILGEEFGIKESENGYTWVIDPIDGTKAFVTGRATFGTLIALCKDDVPVLGVIDQAILGERWIGVEGEVTTFNGTPVQTRSCKKLKNAAAACTAPGMFRNERTSFVEDFVNAVNFVQWGGDCYAYGLLANGLIDVVLEANLSPYDFAALVPIVRGAGGQITDWQGEELTIKSEGKVVALGDLALFSQIKEMLA